MSAESAAWFCFKEVAQGENKKLTGQNGFGMEGKEIMTEQGKLGGAFTLPGTSMSLNRMGYGAMQLVGPQVWGPPRDVAAAIAVLQEAIATGVNHIDTSDYYGPHVTNQIIKQALHPTPTGW